MKNLGGAGIVRLVAVLALLGIFLGTALSPAKETSLKSGIDRNLLDTRIKPGDDFFEYVNGPWNRLNPIPPEYSRWGSFFKLRDDTLVNLKGIVEELAASDESLEGDRRNLRNYFRSAMDEAERNKLGTTPLAEEFGKIEKLRDPNDLSGLLGNFHAHGISGLFHFFVGQDDKDSSRHVAKLWQGGLGLPERDYYLSDAEDSQRIRTEYRGHVVKMFELLGDSSAQAEANATAVMDIETRLAEASRTPVERRDREKQYNKKSFDELTALVPNIDWKQYCRAHSLDSGRAFDRKFYRLVEEVIVGQPEFFERVNGLLSTVPIQDWKAYLRWNLIRSTAPYLSDDFEQEHFRFYSGVLRGVEEMPPRWKRTLAEMDDHIGEPLGRLYVEKYFTKEAKMRMQELVDNLMEVYRQRIETRDWMGPETKKQALAKLATIRPKIGYPDKWRDYSALEFDDQAPYVRNVLLANAFETDHRLSKLGHPVDRDEWFTTPQTVNAYYNASRNEIVFPAGILQPPFFDLSADDAVNYGAIGAVIGHEITHGFDDQGSRSDADGNLKDWWTPADRARFMAKAEKLVKQYDDCVAIGDSRVNGKLTLGENIADLGGVTIAYAAYQASLEGKPAPEIDGLTGPQRFFIGYAQVWRGTDRDEELRVFLRTNPHSPGRFRTLVPLSNVEAFYEAFEVKPGDANYRSPEDRVEIW